jgi:asparagine synthase (glutamine-hydrolysing)
MPSYITQRPKNPRSHASGLHERVRMYKPMFARIHRSYGQHLHEPVPRDFSVLLRQCGNDLDLAIAHEYGPRDHVTDLAGAAKCNARSLIGTLAGPVGIARGAVS